MEAQSAAVSGSFLARNEFLIRRLHSLTGLVPVGAYMVVHLLTNASTLGGPAMFQKNVDLIHSLGPALPIVEWTFIFLPLLFHAVVGVWIVRSGQPNLSSYYYVGNVRYYLQRLTAWIALFFIAWHVFQMHGWFHNDWWLQNIANKDTGGHLFDPHAASSTAALAMKPMIVKIAYFVGVISCVFHLANGLWTMGITWGLWTTAKAQKRANWICGAFGIGLAVIGLSALVGVAKTNVAEAEAYEQAHNEALAAEKQRAEEIMKQKQAAAPAATPTATKN